MVRDLAPKVTGVSNQVGSSTSTVSGAGFGTASSVKVDGSPVRDMADFRNRIAQAGPDAVLTVMAKPNAKLGLVFLDVRRAADAIGRILG